MPATLIPFAVPAGTPIRAEFSVLSVAPAGVAAIPFGVLLLNSQSGQLHWKFRTDIEDLDVSPDDAEYLRLLEEDFRARVGETGGLEMLAWMEDSLSGFLRLSDREAVTGRSVPQMLDRLFAEHVNAAVRPYETHLPFYAVRAAATRFGEERQIDDRDIEWLPAPAGLRMSGDLFVVEVTGRSMEPLIPDGSRAIFRKVGAGSRQGKRLLIEDLGVTGEDARFTVKRYTSAKRPSSDEGEWSHQTIRLEPLNPEFPAFELDPEAFEGKYRVIGEFVQVLPA